MQDSTNTLAQAQAYAEFRFGDSVKAKRLFDGDAQLGLFLTNANAGSCSIEIHGPYGEATISAGPIRYETSEFGLIPTLWCLDLLMSFNTYQLYSVGGTRGLVQAAPLSSWMSWQVKREWPAWSGQVKSREQAAAVFGHPEDHSPPRLRSF